MSNDAVDKFRKKSRDIEYPKLTPYRYKQRLEREKDFKVWTEYYLKDLFTTEGNFYGWADFHFTSFKKIQTAIEQGGNFAFALPRGSGKTSLCKAGILWSLFSGKRRYCLLVGATLIKAKKQLHDLKTIIRFNDKLYQDYPEICGPIRALEGSAKKTETQTAYLEPTNICFTKERLQLPNTDVRFKNNKNINGVAKGSILEVIGITGDIRGCINVLPDGTQIRPDLALVDDFQTRESANSLAQTKTRLKIITEDIAGSSGANNNFAILVPCTVMYRGDGADKILDKKEYPDFRGERMGVLNKLPKNKSLWNEYNEQRILGIEKEDNGKLANKFYKENQKKLERGVKATWEGRKGNCISAIQASMNLYYKFGEDGFMSEYMNSPSEINIGEFEVTEDILKTKLNNIPKRVLPENAHFLTGGIDINPSSGLHWVITAFENNGTAYIVDYGKYPNGREVLYDSKTSQETEEQAVYNGLFELMEGLKEIEYIRGKDIIRPQLISIDVGGGIGDTVFNFIRGYKSSIPLIASRGNANSLYRLPSKKASVGRPLDNCDIRKWKQGKVLVHNTDVWRKRMKQALLLVPRSPNSISLFGDKFSEVEYLASHLCAEKLIDYAQTDKGEFYKWSMQPSLKNDLQDALVMCLANVRALGLQGGGGLKGNVDNNTKQVRTKPKKRNRVSYVNI
ncbi:phage terminase large subunit family protein [Kiritimatiellaeota bacterium B1221]|nr:phage terminase large subunit family protein [Kiritimatiellaeota bacterium B1221]